MILSAINAKFYIDLGTCVNVEQRLKVNKGLSRYYFSHWI
jgi:hypothetical protein